MGPPPEEAAPGPPAAAPPATVEAIRELVAATVRQVGRLPGLTEAGSVREGELIALRCVRGFDPGRAGRGGFDWYFKCAYLKARAKLRTRRGHRPRVRTSRFSVKNCPSDREHDPAAAALSRLEVAELLAHLQPRPRLVVELRHGIGVERPLDLKEIGARIGVSDKRVQQIEAGAILRLQQVARVTSEHRCAG